MDNLIYPIYRYVRKGEVLGPFIIREKLQKAPRAW